MDINAVRFQFFQGDDGRQFLVRTFAVPTEPVGPKNGRSKSVITNREQFLRSLDQNGKAVFERVLDFAKSKTPEMPIHWGAVGFSINADVEGSHVAIYFCYPLTSAPKQSIYTNRAAIGSRSLVPEDEIVKLWNEAEATGLFKPAGKMGDLRCSIDRSFTEPEIGKILSRCAAVAHAIRECGLKK